jgi:hypothetical protein
MYDVRAMVGPVHVLRPDFGSDLLDQLHDFCRSESINLAWISGIGAVSRASLRYYNQAKKDWVDFELDKPVEVVNMIGNVSLLNGEPIVHLHMTVADKDGKCYGGHVANNTIVFTREVLLTTLDGPATIRKMDTENTGLTIWTETE